MKRPDFFIVGAPKCGTKSMDAYLKAHPQLFVPDRKEILYFGTDLENPVRPTEEEYLAHFTPARDDQRAGESTVWYLYSKRGAAEIKAFSPDASIIVMLRNPVDMIYSLHSQHLFSFYEDIDDFSTALDAEEDRKAGRRLPAKTNMRNVPFCRDLLYYSEVGKYTEQIKRYFDHFSRDQIHFIIFDDLKRDTAEAYRQTLKFLGVDDGFQADLRALNANKRVRSNVFRTLLVDPPKIVWKTAGALLPRKLHRRLFQRLKELNTAYVSRPPMDSQLRRRLQEECLPEVERLSELLGRDLSGWCSA